MAPAPAAQAAAREVTRLHRSNCRQCTGLIVAGHERQEWRERSLARAREARANGRRFGTICGRSGPHTRVPDLRLSGNWLRAAGFDFGQHFETEVQGGQLTIRAVD